jgi:hypothetical protein
VISSWQCPLPKRQITNTRDEDPCPQQDSNPRSHQPQASADLRLKPYGHRDQRNRDNLSPPNGKTKTARSYYLILLIQVWRIQRNLGICILYFLVPDTFLIPSPYFVLFICISLMKPRKQYLRNTPRCTICMQYRVNLRELWYRSTYINVAAGCIIWGSDTGESKICIFYPECLDRHWGPPSLLFKVYLGQYPRWSSRRVVRCATHIQLVASLRVRGAIPPVTLHAFNMPCIVRTVYLLPCYLLPLKSNNCHKVLLLTVYCHVLFPVVTNLHRRKE